MLVVVLHLSMQSHSKEACRYKHPLSDSATGDATVTITHRYTPKEQLRQHAQIADIIVAAAGLFAEMVTSWSFFFFFFLFWGILVLFICVYWPAGVPNLITADMVKEGAAVIDVGINRVKDPVTGKDRLVGDVDFEGAVRRQNLWITYLDLFLCSVSNKLFCTLSGVRKKAGYITPVPGGVGPMTVAMLMKNTIKAAKSVLQYPPERVRMAAAS